MNGRLTTTNAAARTVEFKRMTTERQPGPRWMAGLARSVAMTANKLHFKQIHPTCRSTTFYNKRELRACLCVGATATKATTITRALIILLACFFFFLLKLPGFGINMA